MQRRIEKQLASRETAPLVWSVLQGLDYRMGESTALLRQLDRRTVRLPGFVVPLEDRLEEMQEFLLVPWAGACIHTPPPPPNQMVYARMKLGRTAQAWSRPGWRVCCTSGRLNSPYGVVGFQLEGQNVRLLQD